MVPLRKMYFIIVIVNGTNKRKGWNYAVRDGIMNTKEVAIQMESFSKIQYATLHLFPFHPEEHKKMIF